MAWGDSDDWLVHVSDISLKIVKFFHILLNPTSGIFFFHVSNRFEVSAVTEVLALLRAQVNSVHGMVVVHGVEAAINVRDHTLTQRVKAMLLVHFDHAQVAIKLRVEIAHRVASDFTWGSVWDESLGGDLSFGRQCEESLLN